MAPVFEFHKIRFPLSSAVRELNLDGAHDSVPGSSIFTSGDEHGDGESKGDDCIKSISGLISQAGF